MLKENEAHSAKYTPSGKRKFKAKLLSVSSQSQEVFSRAAQAPQEAPHPDVLQRLKFRMTKRDFRENVEEKKPEIPFDLPSPEQSYEKPEPRERHLPKEGEEFKPTSEDFRKKE